MGELLRSVDTALAETEIDRGERKALRELVDVAYSSAGVEEAAEVATKTLDDPRERGRREDQLRPCERRDRARCGVTTRTGRMSPMQRSVRMACAPSAPTALSASGQTTPDAT
jgi:hypothetical protein